MGRGGRRSCLLLAACAYTAGVRAELAEVGHSNPYYPLLGYRGTHVLEHNQSERFEQYVEYTWPQAAMPDHLGRIWVADRNRHVVVTMENSTRHVPWAAYYEAYAGRPGIPGHTDGRRELAMFSGPSGISVTGDPSMPLEIYVADTGNHCIRRIKFDEGRVATIVGSAGNPGFRDGAGLYSRFNSPKSIGVALDGRSIVVLDNGRHIRHVDLSVNPPVVRTLEGGACRTVRSETLLATLKVRTVGCHPDWVSDPNSLSGGVGNEALPASTAVCLGHIATCAPRHFPAKKDSNSPQLEPRPTNE